tara:strand:+ start:823 stop:1677 length:855 start_codon:yes stop_codon:yes gene_type:complete
MFKTNNLCFLLPQRTQITNRIMKNTIHHSVNPVNGLDLGIPLNIVDNIFTNLNYGFDITTMKVVLLQFLIGYYTYGKDRFKDALEYRDNPYETKKKELYEKLIQYRGLYSFSYCLSFYLISFIMLIDENHLLNLPIILLLFTTEYYTDLKQYISILKPFYVSFMWTAATVFMPCLLYDNNYSILLSPQIYLPCFLTLFASSNLADIMDIDEDRTNNINTLPVKYGKTTTTQIIMFSLMISSLFFGLNENYLNRPIINSLYELQNALISCISMYINYKNNTKNKI